tara:strand:+ start:651 stop:1067 length:417 start_codon:yes stop_codon:yes gene_type:complete
MFFKNNKKENDDKGLINIAALLIHTAKIDENYSIKEEEIINKALLKIGAENDNIEKIIESANKIEANSNQILDFTKEVKNMNNDYKIKIIEALWQIIYSDKKADVYEANLMRRLAGLLYIDDVVMGNIKDKIKKENSK